MSSQITSLTIVYSTVLSGADQRKHQSSASLAFVREIHRSPMNSQHKRPVTRKMFPFDDVIMLLKQACSNIMMADIRNKNNVFSVNQFNGYEKFVFLKSHNHTFLCILICFPELKMDIFCIFHEVCDRNMVCQTLLWHHSNVRQRTLNEKEWGQLTPWEI